MIRCATVVPDSYESITRPVSLQISRDLLKQLGLPDTLDVLFPGGVEEVAQKGSTLQFNQQHARDSKFTSDGRLQIEVTEDAIEDRILTTAVRQGENIAIFFDPALGVKMWPVYSGTELKFQFTFRSPNRVLAKRFRDDFLMKTAEGQKELLFEIKYHYGIPSPYLHLFKHIHDLREAVAGYGDSYDEWMTNHLSKRATNLTTAIGTQMQLAITEAQTRVMGYFDFSAGIEPESKDKEDGTWNVNFAFTATFDKVIGVCAEYPYIVHNQLIDEIYQATPVIHGDYVNPYNKNDAPSLSRYAFDRISELNFRECCPDSILVTIPENDPWRARDRHKRGKTIDVLNIQLMVDLEDPRAILNLETDLGENSFEDLLIPYLKLTYRGLTRYRQGLFHIQMYEGENQIGDRAIEIDADLNIRATFDLDPRKNYHLTVSLLSDLTLLSSSVLEQLRANGAVAKHLLVAIQKVVHKRAIVPKLIRDKYLSNHDLGLIAQFLNDSSVKHNAGVRYPLTNNVGNFTILTLRPRLHADGREFTHADYQKIITDERAAEREQSLRDSLEITTGNGPEGTIQHCDC